MYKEERDDDEEEGKDKGKSPMLLKVKCDFTQLSTVTL